MMYTYGGLTKVSVRRNRGDVSNYDLGGYEVLVGTKRKGRTRRYLSHYLNISIKKRVSEIPDRTTI